jgi:hypothetical protein
MFEPETKPLGSPTTSYGPIDSQNGMRAQRAATQGRRRGVFGSLFYGVRDFVGVFIDAINGRYDR